MPVDKFLIGLPASNGLVTNLEPFMIPDDAYAQLNNAYVWRGRVRKRFGSQYMINNQLDSRLAVQVGTVAIPVSPVPPAAGAIGQAFSISDTIFYVYQANGAMYSTGVATGTFDTATGAFAFANTGGFAGGTPIFWYPSLPVMGITQYEIGPINDNPSYAFDTSYAYFFNGANWTRAGTAVWTGTNYQFFWSTTWQGLNPGSQALFTTNNSPASFVPAVAGDPIRFWDGAAWNDFTPQFLTAGSFVSGCLIILSFKDRLLLLNTTENTAGVTTNFGNRCRYSINGNPLIGGGPLYPTSWLESTQVGSKGAGYVDATTEESIVSAEFIKDRLIVYFERSTWELSYTNNEVLPFRWQKINTELGSQSLQSSVPFDKIILTIGNTGVHACSGANVERIDELIPDKVFQIQLEDNAEARIAGIRDYFTEMVYWTMSTNQVATLAPFPNRVLVYNYAQGTWAFNDDCITAFGYFEQQGDVTWQTTDATWQEYDYSWISGLGAAQQRQILIGNQQGFVYRLDPGAATNEHVMQLTNATQNAQGVTLTIVNHTLAPGDFIHLEGEQVDIGDTDVNGDFVGNVGAIYQWLVGQYFIVGTSVYTSITAGVAQPMAVNGIGVATYDTTNGNVTITGGPPLTPIIFYYLPPSFTLLPGINNIDNIYEVSAIPNANTVFINNVMMIGTYAGGITVSRVSQIQILSKQWNFYTQEAMNVFIQKIDFNVTRTSQGQITIDYYPSFTEESMIMQGQATGMLLGTNVLETSPYPSIPLEAVQDRLWHPVYFQSIGETLQLYIYLSTEQMMTQAAAFSVFELNGLIVYAYRSGRLQ